MQVIYIIKFWVIFFQTFQGYDVSPVLYSHRGLIGRSFDSHIHYPYNKYPPYSTVPYYGSSKASHADILGKVRGDIIKGKYWSGIFSGGFHKQYDGGIISGRYVGDKGLYRGHIVRRTHEAHLYRGIYKQFSKTTFFRGTLNPSGGIRRSSSGFIKQRWLLKKLHLGYPKQTLPLRGTILICQEDQLIAMVSKEILRALQPINRAGKEISCAIEPIIIVVP